jgi:hypothetical protein
MITSELDRLASAAAGELVDVSVAGTDTVARRAELDRLRRQRRAGLVAVTVLAVVGVVVAGVVVAGSVAGTSRRVEPAKPVPHHTTKPVPFSHPTHVAELPPPGAALSLPARGRVVLSVSPARGGDWNVYADGRVIWQRSNSAGDPLVIPNGATSSQTGYVQQRLTPQGVQLLLSRVLSIGQSAGLFGRIHDFTNPAFGDSYVNSTYQVCSSGHLLGAQVSYSEGPLLTPSQTRAFAQIDRLAAGLTSALPASAWVDRTIRPYVPSHYEIAWDRSAPDPSKMPSPAGEALLPLLKRSKEAALIITAGQTRTLLRAFTRSGIKTWPGGLVAEMDFHLPAAKAPLIPTTVLGIWPLLPGSPLSDPNRC